MTRQIRLTLTVTAVVVAAAQTASAQGLPRVAIVSAASTSVSTALAINLDTQAKLQSTGFFEVVDILDIAVHAAYTPTLTELLAYDAILTFSNGTYADATLLGNTLADYVDAGGGVVVANYAVSSTGTGRRIEGRWRIGGDYEIIRSGSGSAPLGQHGLGAILIPGHPILQNVTSFLGGESSARPNGTALSPHGQLVAEWTDGRVLIAVSTQFPGRVDLGMFPPSSDTGNPGRWTASTDGHLIMGNALMYTIQGQQPACYANCDGSSTEPVLNVDDFTCFINEYASAQSLPHEQQVSSYANCDSSTTAPALNVDDFTCFINRFAAGCP
jgi:hypothetical protein